MNHRCNSACSTCDAVNNSVAVRKDFSNSAFIKLGHDSASEGKFFKATCGIDYLPDDRAGISRGWQWLRRRRGHCATILLGKPFAQLALDVILSDRSVSVGYLETTSDFFDHVEMILTIFKRAVVWQLAQQGFDFLFGSDHKNHSTPQHSRLSKLRLKCIIQFAKTFSPRLG
jgi:hypothetical protein